ncbi:hypothetical protein MTO96_010993 [Rhipicephalus appendiculatus]
MGSPLLLLLLLVGTVWCQRKDQSVCRKDNGLFEHEQYCDYYYECEDGVPTLQLCPNGLAFSGKNRGLLNNCDYPHRVGCPDDDGRVMGQSPQSSENCHWQYGVFAHQTSCTREPPPTTPPPEEAEERPQQQQRPRPQQQAAARPPQQAAPSGQRRFSPPPQSVPALAQASPVADQDDDYTDAGQNRAQGVVRRPASFRQAVPASTGK